MLKSAGFACIAFLAAFGAASPPVAGLEAVIEAVHSSGQFDGVVVLVQAGNVTFAKGVGEADRSRHILNRPDTVYRLASLTKQVTALLVMQEVASGKISLETKAAQVLPSLPASSGRVTVRQLLQHVSGLPNPSDGPEGAIPSFYTRGGRDAADVSKNAAGFCSQNAKREPGAQFEYNNCDYIVLGALLEKLNGATFAQLVAARVVRPLGLKSWGMFPASPRKAPRTAVGYREDGSVELAQNPATYGAAGGLYGSALDVAKWDAALLSHKLLNAEATRVMFQADPKLYGEALGSWSYDLETGNGVTHVVERQGDMGGTRILNLLLPAKDAALIVIANTERADLFNTYSKKGFGFSLIQALFVQ